MGSAEETAIYVLINTIFDMSKATGACSKISHFCRSRKSASCTSGVNSILGLFGLQLFSLITPLIALAHYANFDNYEM
jgi:hypothetical protein